MKQHECAATKVCNECKEEKNLTEFYTRWNRKRTERQAKAKCKDCANKLSRDEYSSNPEKREKILSRQAISHSTPEYKEQRKIYSQAYNEENREKISDQKNKNHIGNRYEISYLLLFFSRKFNGARYLSNRATPSSF